MAFFFWGGPCVCCASNHTLNGRITIYIFSLHYCVSPGVACKTGWGECRKELLAVEDPLRHLKRGPAEIEHGHGRPMVREYAGNAFPLLLVLWVGASVRVRPAPLSCLTAVILQNCGRSSRPRLLLQMLKNEIRSVFLPLLLQSTAVGRRCGIIRIVRYWNSFRHPLTITNIQTPPRLICRLGVRYGPFQPSLHMERAAATA